jgi:hypothetical protein
MGLVGNKRGQFIIIAALLIAIMIISASAVMFSAVTYFKHERWEEYLIVIDGVKTGTANVLQLSLANYTQALNNTVLKTNMDSWRMDVKKAYTGFGAIASYSLASGAYTAYGMSLNYVNGLNCTWNKQISFSAANATGNLNITSVGLTGYGFVSTVFLKMHIADALYYKGQGSNPDYVGVRVIMYAEGPVMLTKLVKSNFVLFQIGDSNVTTWSLYRYYESTLNAFVYDLRYQVPKKSDPVTATATISVVDARGIKVTGQAPFTTVNA